MAVVVVVVTVVSVAETAVVVVDCSLLLLSCVAGLEKRASSRGRRRIDISPSQRRVIQPHALETLEKTGCVGKLASKLSKPLSASSEQAKQAQKPGGPQRLGVADPDPMFQTLSWPRALPPEAVKVVRHKNTRFVPLMPSAMIRIGN